MSYKEIEIKGYEELMNKYHINSLLAKIVKSFNYSEKDLATFFYPLTDYELDDDVFSPIKNSLEKIKENKSKVFIFGDYDCDGICATTIMSMILTKLDIQHGYYLPDRQKEGYGLNLERLKQAYEKGYRVLITVDNGVSCYQQLNWAKEHDMYIIVTDHHTIIKDFDYDQFLHPCLLKEDYRYLSGAAIVFLLAKYMGLNDDKMNILAMLSIISDVMSLKGINIKIVKDGLALFNKHRYYNLEVLDKLSYPISEYDLSFKIIPKINSIGRLSDQANVNTLVRFLLCQDKRSINYYASEINKLNNLRKQMTTEQYKLIKDSSLSEKVNFIYYPSLHEGLLGVIAAMIMNQNNKATFIMTDSTEGIKGSARSLNGTDLMALLDDFKDNFINLGGHSGACGFTIASSKLNDLKQYLDNNIQSIEKEVATEYIEIDQNDLAYEKIKEVYNYRPYGQDRKIPLMKVTFDNIKDYRKLKTDEQLKWTTDSGLQILSFSNKGYQYYLNKDKITVVGELSENNFNNHTYYQIIAKEILD